jgi:hypothetical protein
MEIGLLRMKNTNPEDSEGYGVGALMLPEVFVQKVIGRVVPGSATLIDDENVTHRYDHPHSLCLSHFSRTTCNFTEAALLSFMLGMRTFMQNFSGGERHPLSIQKLKECTNYTQLNGLDCG